MKITQGLIRHPMPNPNTRSARTLIKMLQASRRDARRSQDYHRSCNKLRLRFAALAIHLIENVHGRDNTDSIHSVY